MAPRPPANVLDLRQPVTPPPTSHRRWGRSSPSPMHRPPRPPRDWFGLGREASKFALAILIVAACFIAGRGLWEAWTEAQRAADLGKAAALSLQQGSQALGQHDPAAARAKFSTAADQVAQAKAQLNDIDGFGGRLIVHLPWVGHRVSTAHHLLNALASTANAGQLISKNITAEQLAQPAVSIDTKGIVNGSIAYIPSLITRYADWQTIVNDGLAAINELSQVRSQDLPSSLAPVGALFDQFRPLITGPQARVQPLVELLNGLVATPKAKDLLVIFQNNDELRATGGFAGTFLLVEFNQGTFKILDAPGNGPFALTEQVPHTALPPQPLLAINPYWAFQDTNWFLDTPTSADFALDIYQQARGFRPDGVLYVSPPLVEALLEITGPVRPEKYTVDITADNFVRATEQQVQFGYDKALNNPKQFVLDLIPTLIKKLSTLPAADGLRAGLTFIQEADEGNLLLFSETKTLQQTIERVGWDGKLRAPTGSQPLAIVDENLTGGKTDRVVDERVHVEATDQATQTDYTVTVTRRHGGKVGDVLSGDTNRVFNRVYAPSNAIAGKLTGSTVPPSQFFFSPASGAVASSALLSAEGQTLVDQQTGLRITHESDRLVMGGWSFIAPGQEQTLTYTFSVPHDQGEDWTLFWQKQPGATRRSWTVTYHAPKGKRISSAPGATVSDGRQTARWSANSDTNHLFGLVF